MPKKKKLPDKMPYSGTPVSIYGILNLKTNKLIEVKLKKDDIWLEYDLSLLDETKFVVVKLNVLF